MKLVIDAYNLYHAARAMTEDASSLTVGAFAAKLDAWAGRTRTETAVVFDGSVPRGSNLPRQGRWGQLWIRFSGSAGSADAVIIDFIISYSAARTLAVLTDDREIRKAARRRRCKTLSCQAFWAELEKLLSRPEPVREPVEKRGGLSDEDTDYWLREFGLDR